MTYDWVVSHQDLSMHCKCSEVAIAPCAIVMQTMSQPPMFAAAVRVSRLLSPKIYE